MTSVDTAQIKANDPYITQNTPVNYNTPGLNVPVTTATDYYSDTISSANDSLPSVVNSALVEANTKTVEARLESISEEIDEILKKNDINFEKLQSQIYRVIMLLMRLSAKNDHQFVVEMNREIRVQAAKVQGTYNTWPGLVCTVVSAGVSGFGGLAGLTPLLPQSVINPATASVLSQASQSIGTAGTGVSGLGSVFNNKEEAKRGVYQIDSKQMQDKEDDKKSSKQSNNEAKKAAKAANDQFNQTIHETAKSVTG